MFERNVFLPCVNLYREVFHAKKSKWRLFESFFCLFEVSFFGINSRANRNFKRFLENVIQYTVKDRLPSQKSEHFASCSEGRDLKIDPLSSIWYKAAHDSPEKAHSGHCQENETIFGLKTSGSGQANFSFSFLENKTW